MKRTIKALKDIDTAINKTLDNLGTDDFDDSIPFELSYNGHKATIIFCPESVDGIQTLIKNLVETFEEDYL